MGISLVWSKISGTPTELSLLAIVLQVVNGRQVQFHTPLYAARKLAKLLEISAYMHILYHYDYTKCGK